MGKTWVLDTETKGTGAQMLPLEKVLEQPVEEPRPIRRIPPRRRPVPAEAPAPKEPRRFRVVDVMTREVLAEDADVRATVDALRDVRSAVDVGVYVWDPSAAEWRQLSLRERRAMWRLRDR